MGTVPEAEDVLQEAWLRWHRVDRTTVIDVEAFLVAVTVRLAINLVQSAHRRHETSVAPWLGEEEADPAADPLTAAERGEAIELAVRLLLERLSPSQRAAFLLREGFEYPYQQIARTLQIDAANARQLVKRARARIAAGPRHSYSSISRGRLLRAFAPACLVGELSGLEAVLVADLRRASREPAPGRKALNLV